jgi:hypothetical protein
MAATLRRLLLLPFLGKQKRYVVAGLPPASNRTTTTELKKQTTKNKNNSKPSAHIPCASQASMPEEAHGICAVAEVVF